MGNGKSKLLFIIDLTFLLFFFFFVYKGYTGETTIPLKGSILMGLVVIAWFLISVDSNILRIDTTSHTIDTLKDIFIAYSVLSTFTIATVAIFGEFRPNDKLILYPLLFSAISSAILRLSYRIINRQFFKYGYRQKSVLIIGSRGAARQLINKLLSTPELGLKIFGILADTPPEGQLKKYYLGKIEKFNKILGTHPIDEVIIAKPLTEVQTITRIAESCEGRGVRFYIAPDFHNIIPKWTILTSLGDIPVIALRNEPLNVFGNRIVKRIFDILVSFSALLLLSPILAFIAISIKMTSPGPVLFRQKRIGSNNLEFTLLKFRTMTVQSPAESNTTWTLPDDRRVTPFGKVLRQTNLDELPQLWNVLVGDMSIVGPRPERKHFVEKFSMEIPNYRTRHLIKSGITGLAQANGWRGNTSIRKRVENDLYYIENWSLWLDLKIIAKTFLNPAAWKNAI